MAASSPQDREAFLRRPRWYRRERLLLAACIVLLLLATIPPLINLGRFQHRITSAISRSIGRPVSVDAISLRLLPWPAFQISNLVVNEDPAFGAEPALRAPDVLAEPRLSSLWRGHFELSRVELADASVNLVRNSNGRWSIASVLLQASHVQNAPTSQAHPGTAPRFPYIEATGTRINIKQGVEKLPYSLLNADFSMWLERPEVWQLKLEGQPVRTDLALSLGDTGLLRVEGELHRASAFGTMPLKLQGEWNHAPFGQLSRLLLGRDVGWRGDIDATGVFEGEIDHLDIRSHLLVHGLHRQEFTPDQPFTVDATCHSLYSRSQPAIDASTCHWPLGQGAIEVSHAASDAPGAVTLAANKVPANVVAQAVGLLRPGTPAPGRFSGLMDGSLLWTPFVKAGSAATLLPLTGTMQIPTLTIAGGAPTDTALTLTRIQLRAGVGPDLRLMVTADPVSLGVAGAPVRIAAELGRQSYAVHANGSATLAGLHAVAAALRLPNLGAFSPLVVDHLPAPQALADLALTSSGPWLGTEVEETGGFTGGTTGSLHLMNMQWAPGWLPTPLSFSAADAAFSPGTVRWSSPAVSFGANHFSGIAQVTLNCVPQTPCATQIMGNAAALDATALQAALAGSSGSQQLLSNLLNRVDPSRIHLPPVQGTLHAGILTLGRLPLHDTTLVLTTLAAAEKTEPSVGPRIEFSSMDGRTLGGMLHLRGFLTLSGGAPHYSMQAVLSGASVAQAAALWHENWGSGVLGATADFTLAGASTADLLNQMKGTFRAAWTQGGLAGDHAGLPPALLHFSSWDAAGTLGPAGLTLTSGALNDPSEKPFATLAGTVQWDRTVALTYTPEAGAGATTITGSLAAPSVEKPAAP